jgi:site-specific recombinase XerD
MSVTTKLLLRESKKRSDGKAPIWLRITANRRSRYISSGIFIEPEDWNENRSEVRKSHPLADSYNAHLRELHLEAEKAALESETAKEVKSKLKDDAGEVTRFFKQYINRLDESGNYHGYKHFRVTLRKLHEALGEDLKWSQLDRKALKTFERYCREERDNNPNTTRKELTRVHRIVKLAIKEGILSAAEDPFIAYDMPEKVKTEKRGLSSEEMRAIEEVGLEEGSNLALARDFFVFAFYGGGVRFGDMCCLKRENLKEERLQYRMMKTDKLVSIPLPPPALEIANRWVERHNRPFLFPYLEEGDTRDPGHLRRRIGSHNTMVNRRVKKVARKAELTAPDEITFHVARHSFANIARQRSGDLYALNKALAHGNLSTTQEYLAAFDQDAVDNLLNNEVWNDESTD